MTMTHAACRFALVLALLTSGAAAQDYSYTSPDSAVRINGGIGALYLRGNEYVFTGDATLSQLIWETRAPVLRGSLAVDVGSGFSLSAEGSVAGFGSSYMEDYDWLVRTNNFDNWTHRSQHPDTRMEHYVTGAAMVGYDLVKDPDAVVRMQAGVKYSDVKWSAYGGSYIYSSNGFRNVTGNIPDGTIAGSYRQMLPEVFVGFDGDQTYGNIRVGGMLRGGLTVLAQSRDNHWLRDLLIVDNFRPAPTFAAGLDVGFSFGPMAEFVVAARYDQAFQMRGKSEYFDTRTGVRTIVDDNIGGADLRSAEITAGLRGRF
ncbi:omptin family outer membrane protease [Devosia aquimaris]|uniref:omptin family outer membrane protease n=1 Tax=Devosia aquimaris TaxID=2866214 RepID=UPI001CD0C240|nr:omptin family outer membrane protease [Devosia sp. CJK-A8-3]